MNKIKREKNERNQNMKIDNEIFYEKDLKIETDIKYDKRELLKSKICKKRNDHRNKEDQEKSLKEIREMCEKL